MESNDSSGGWIVILVIALIWALFFHHDTYNGKTAQEWATQYDDLNTNYQNASSTYSSLITCLEDNRVYHDYYGYYGYDVYDVSAVNNCKSTASLNMPSDFGN